MLFEWCRDSGEKIMEKQQKVEGILIHYLTTERKVKFWTTASIPTFQLLHRYIKDLFIFSAITSFVNNSEFPFSKNLIVEELKSFQVNFPVFTVVPVIISGSSTIWHLFGNSLVWILNVRGILCYRNNHILISISFWNWNMFLYFQWERLILKSETFIF